MNAIVFSLFLFFTPNIDQFAITAPGESGELKRIVYDKIDQRIDYVFESEKWQNVYSVSYEKGTKNLLLTFREKEEFDFQLRLVDHKNVQINRGKSWTDVDPGKNYLKVKERIKFEDLVSGVRTVNMNSSRPANGAKMDFGNSIPTMQEALGQPDANNADDCTQSGTCSCGDSSVSVTCACGRVITCEERTVELCDYDDAGEPINCRPVRGCAGLCL